MSQENSNTQTAQPNPTPVPPAGPSVEELKAQIAELERQSEGRLRDLQTERSRRQELEQRVNTVPAPSAAPQPNDVSNDELAKVLNPYIGPVAKKVEAAESFMMQYQQDKAIEYLASKTGKKREDILSDTKFQERLLNTSRKYGLTGNMYDVATRSYEIMELEDLREKEAERQRQNAVSSNASMPSGSPLPPATSGREYSVEDWRALPLAEYEKLEQAYVFKKVGDKIVATPKS